MKIVGITSCTCGIAHTYMAREKLLETGKKLGWSVKIETQGSGGIEFALTDQFLEQNVLKENQLLRFLFQQQLNHQNIY